MKIIAIHGLSNSGKDTVAKIIKDNNNFCPISFADPVKRLAKQVFSFDDQQLWGPSEFRNLYDIRYHDPDCKAWKDAIDNLYVSSWGEIRRSRLNSSIVFEMINDIVFDAYSQASNKNFDPATKAYKAFDDFCAVIKQLKLDHTRLSPRVVLQTLGTEFGRVKVYEDLWIDYFFEMAYNVDCINYQAIHHPQRQFRYAAKNTDPGYKGVVAADLRFMNEYNKLKERGAITIKLMRPSKNKNQVGIINHASEQGLSDDLFDHIIINDGSLEDLNKKVLNVL